MYYTVYQITNTINGKCYVGVHQTTNLNDGYMGSGKLIKAAIKKYGVENFKKEYIKVFDTPDDMFRMETELVTTEFVLREDTYNMKEGGLGGNTSHYVDYSDPEHSRKIQEALKHKKEVDIDYVNRLVAHAAHMRQKVKWVGRKHKESSKQKMSESSKGIGKGETNSQFGTCWVFNEELKQSKKIKKDDLQTWLDKGWQQGRKIKF